MSSDDSTSARWGRFRFSVVGPLLASPPEHGELAGELSRLAARAYKHPVTGERVHFSVKTLERWFYLAKNHPTDPVRALSRKTHARAGTHPAVREPLRQVLRAQYEEHPKWTFQLHHDNLEVLVDKEPALGPMPSYATVCRFMKNHGMPRRKQRKRREEPELEHRETRSYEASCVQELWHLDFHQGSLRVLTRTGERVKPQLFGCLDDRSRLACHLQWYLDENLENCVHGFQQALLKRGKPYKLMTDNGGAETGAEFTEGLERLGILHATTLPYHPNQNGKQECFWGQIEGRLLPMLEGHPELTLQTLNEATQAWVELEYNRTRHSEIADTPLHVFTSVKSVGRDAPSSKELRRAFRMSVSRKQRRSDGTLTVDGVRFEIPAAFLSLQRVRVRYARWDLSTVDLVDPRSGELLATLFPLDKHKNADGRRRVSARAGEPETPAAPAGIAPLLSKLMTEYAATGLPPAYLAAPHHETKDPT